ncbi:uncharacterized protein LOC135834175 [Planococcus citri]|uniref:uncharacterized protein LOC135834175 n=1 Tax=Planococcus citri TaxID=170843 RepID=UPI0031F73C1C
MNSPSNRILAHLAFADFIVLVSYIPNNLLWNIDRYRSDFCLADSYGWTMFFWYNDIFTSTFEFVSVFLTVQLAVWRYISVVHPWKQRQRCNEKITRNVIITGYVVCCILYAIPFRLSFDIKTINNNQNTNAHYKFTIEGHLIMHEIRSYIYGLVIKLFPSVLLVWLTFKIVFGLSARKRNHEQLTASTSAPSNVKNLEMRKQTNTSTVILLAVVISVTIAHINTSITFMVYYILKLDPKTLMETRKIVDQKSEPSP